MNQHVQTRMDRGSLEKKNGWLHPHGMATKPAMLAVPKKCEGKFSERSSRTVNSQFANWKMGHLVRGFSSGNGNFP